MGNDGIKVFHVVQNFIAIDGPDGAGKSTFSELLASKLSSELGRHVAVIQPTQFHTSSSARKLQCELEKSGAIFDTRQHNDFYLRAMRANYEEVVLPALESGTLVILDSSELRALAFMRDKGTAEAYADTLAQIRSGNLTCGLQPKVRLIMTASPLVFQQNLSTKSGLDRGDPASLSEINRRIDSYRQAESFFMGIQTDKDVNWLHLDICHQERCSMRSYLMSMLDERVLPTIHRMCVEEEVV